MIKFIFLYLFSFRGRASRLAYGVAILAISLVFLAGFGLLKSTSYFWPLAILSLPLLVSGYAFTIRRLHDINLSGWWAFSLFVFKGLLSAVYANVAYGMWLNASDLISLREFAKEDPVQLILPLIFKLAFIAFLLFMPGTKGLNSYDRAENKTVTVELD